MNENLEAILKTSQIIYLFLFPLDFIQEKFYFRAFCSANICAVLFMANNPHGLPVGSGRHTPPDFPKTACVSGRH